MPLSDFVGLVLRTVIVSPERMLPPTNSLPPLRCPVPEGLMGIDRGDSGPGECGGLKKEASAIGAGDSDAPGLKENDGRAGDLGFPFSLSIAIDSPESFGSMADRGRLPVARENDDGAEYDDGRAGKTNGGFGRGSADFGDISGLAGPESCEDMPSRVGIAAKRPTNPLSRPSVVGASAIMSGPAAAAIFPSRSAAPEEMGNFSSQRVTWIFRGTNRQIIG